MLLAANESWLTPFLSSFSSAILSSSVLGYALLTIGVIATLLSSYRYLLLYFLGGMGYWLVVEVIQSGLVDTFAISVWHSYVAALASTWLIPSIWVTYRLSSSPESEKRSSKHLDTYIEHTPIYENYTPRFPGY